MSLSRNLWSLFLVLGTVAVGTLVLVLNRDDEETTFSKRARFDPIGALTQIADESKGSNSTMRHGLQRQTLIRSVVRGAIRQDRGLATKIIREQMQGATQIVAIAPLIQAQIAAGDVVLAMDSQLLISGDRGMKVEKECIAGGEKSGNDCTLQR